jgi:hypothetical protein
MGVAVYARVSTIRQAQSQTIEQQLDRLRAAVAERGWDLRDSTRNQTRSHSRAASSTGASQSVQGIQADRYEGSPSQPAVSPQLAPGARVRSEGSADLLREPLAGTTVQTIPGTFGHLRAWFSQFRCVNQRGELGAILAVFRLTSEGPQVRTLLRPPGQSSKDGASPAETRWGAVFCSPAGYGCSRLTAAGCAEYAPKSVCPGVARCHQRAAWVGGESTDLRQSRCRR